MPYLRRTPLPSDPNYLAELVVRHVDPNYYEVVNRLASQLELRPADRLKLRRRVKYLVEGYYSRLKLNKG